MVSSVTFPFTVIAKIFTSSVTAGGEDRGRAFNEQKGAYESISPIIKHAGNSDAFNGKRNFFLISRGLVILVNKFCSFSNSRAVYKMNMLLSTLIQGILDTVSVNRIEGLA